MVYCSNCGAKLSEEAYFCPKCGVKTQIGVQAKAAYPSEELREAFTRAGLELEKAFTIAARETHAALKKATQNIQQKPTPQESKVCTVCETKNPSAQFSVTAVAKK
jgi:ribosomal protein L40E